MRFKTECKGYELYFAEEKDLSLILSFINKLAEYENLRHEVVATEALLREWIFDKKVAEVLIGEYEGEAVSFALFFYNYSTFEGRAGIYMEDLFVLPQYRKKGFGKAILRRLSALAVSRGCARLEEWTTYRLSGDALLELAKES